jgi:hypothetical protein
MVAVGLLIVWIVGYRMLDPKTHLGAFFGNAIADWSGSVVIILGTKFLYEIGSAESRSVKGKRAFRVARFSASAFAFDIHRNHRDWLGSFVCADECGQQMGSGSGQHCLRMGADGRPRLPYQTADRNRLQRESPLM